MMVSDREAHATNPAGPSGPLVGVKVLDISTVIAGPLAATMLADFGADVLKIELPGAGDHIRHLPPHKDGVPLWSKVVNRNKLGISLDLKKPEGLQVFERIVPGFDVLVENFRPGTLDKWGLSAARLHELNPRLIILRVTGFGQTGPNRNKPGFARIFEALSGFVNLCGEPDGPPLYPGYPISDGVTGIFGALAVVAALRHRDHAGAGLGQEIDLSATEAMFRILDFMAIEYDQNGTVRHRSGNLNAYSAPSSVYRTRDEKWIALAVSAPTVFARLARAIGREDLLYDEKFKTNVARLEHREEIEEIMRDWFLARTADEAMTVFTKHEVSASPIYNIADIFEDAHFAAREAIVSVPDADFGSVKMQGVVPRFSNTPGKVWRTGPALGEHNSQIYRDQLGIDPDTLKDLENKKVI
jgi:crotonobetainyl-CoA:carnitine CoA-transferase CaiB-like acyl-CoA transferase